MIPKYQLGNQIVSLRVKALVLNKDHVYSTSTRITSNKEANYNRRSCLFLALADMNNTSNESNYVD